MERKEASLGEKGGREDNAARVQVGNGVARTSEPFSRLVAELDDSRAASFSLEDPSSSLSSPSLLFRATSLASLARNVAASNAAIAAS